MAQRHLDDREADADAMRAHRQCGGEWYRIGIDALAGEVVLGEPDPMEAQLLGERRLLELLEDGARVLLGRRRVRKRQPAKSHVSLRSLGGAGPIVTARATRRKLLAPTARASSL